MPQTDNVTGFMRKRLLKIARHDAKPYEGRRGICETPQTIARRSVIHGVNALARHQIVTTSVEKLEATPVIWIAFIELYSSISLPCVLKQMIMHWHRTIQRIVKSLFESCLLHIRVL